MGLARYTSATGGLDSHCPHSPTGDGAGRTSGEARAEIATRTGSCATMRAIAALGERGGDGLVFEAMPSSAGDCKIAVTATGSVPGSADTASLAAQAYAMPIATSGNRSPRARIRRSKQAAARAEQELREAQANLQGHYEQQLRAAQDGGPAAALSPTRPGLPRRRLRRFRAAGGRKPRVGGLEPPASLRCGSGEPDLLIHRTPLHPDVLDIEARIQQLEQQIGRRAADARRPNARAGCRAPLRLLWNSPNAGTAARLSRWILPSCSGSSRLSNGRNMPRPIQPGLSGLARQSCQQEPTIDLEQTQADAAGQTPRSTLSKLMAALAAGLSSVEPLLRAPQRGGDLPVRRPNGGFAAAGYVAARGAPHGLPLRPHDLPELPRGRCAVPGPALHPAGRRSKLARGRRALPAPLRAALPAGERAGRDRDRHLAPVRHRPPDSGCRWHPARRVPRARRGRHAARRRWPRGGARAGRRDRGSQRLPRARILATAGPHGGGLSPGCRRGRVPHLPHGRPRPAPLRRVSWSTSAARIAS